MIMNIITIMMIINSSLYIWRRFRSLLPVEMGIKREERWRPSALVFLIVGIGIIFLDPLGMGPMGRHQYRPVKLNIAPYPHVMASWRADNASRLRTGRREFVGEVFGPESMDFDLLGRGPYTGLADGRVVRWTGPDPVHWETFALVTANWSEEKCSNGLESTTKKQHEKEEKCGRPLGLRFDRRTGDLYIADAYHGLLVVGKNGGTATQVASHADGKRILFANDLDIHSNGSVFFTDTSARYSRRDHFFILLEGESTGRLLRYDPPTKKTHVLISGLAFPNGVQLSDDQTFLLFAETTNCRVMRYWLEGPEAGKLEIFINLPGYPDNVRKNDKGQFWVATDCCRTAASDFLSRHPWLRNIYFRLPFKLNFLAKSVGMKMYTVLALLGPNGQVLEVLQDKVGDVAKLVSEVQEVHGKLWLGTVAHNHIVTVPYPLQQES